MFIDDILGLPRKKIRPEDVERATESKENLLRSRSGSVKKTDTTEKDLVLSTELK